MVEAGGQGEVSQLQEVWSERYQAACKDFIDHWKDIDFYPSEMGLHWRVLSRGVMCSELTFYIYSGCFVEIMLQSGMKTFPLIQIKDDSGWKYGISKNGKK